MTSQPPIRFPWTALRCATVVGALAVISLMVRAPAVGLTVFWDGFVPLLPLLFLIAPGLWRNICPMATLNQIPVTQGWTLGRRIPAKAQQWVSLSSAALFVMVLPLRVLVFDQSGPATAGFLLVALALAFTGGLLFLGKSGWCTTICPLAHLERFYGQSPLVVVANSHCRPCSGCVRSCYDQQPTTAHLADAHGGMKRFGGSRRWLAGLPPWLIVAFFTQPALPVVTGHAILALYARMLCFGLAGIGAFLALERLAPGKSYQIVLTHVATALNLFYLWAVPLSLGQLSIHSLLISGAIQTAVLALSAVWLWRALPRERAFLQTRVQLSGVRLSAERAQGQVRSAGQRSGPRYGQLNPIPADLPQAS